MTKQEEIREGIHKIILLWSNEDTRIGGQNTLRLRERIITYLHKQGVVIKVEKEHTSDFVCDDYMNGLGWLTEHDRTPTERELDRFIRALGYVSVEELL